MIRLQQKVWILLAAGFLAAFLFVFLRPFPATPTSEPDATTSPIFRACVRSTIHFAPKQGTRLVRIRMLVIPPRLDHQRLVSRMAHPSPTDSGSDESSSWLEWRNALPSDSSSVVLEQCVERLRHDLATEPSATSSLEHPSSYLGADSLRPLDHPSLRKLALSISPGDPVQQVIYAWDTVRARLRYGGYDPIDQGAARALANGVGDCSEYSDLQTSLLRILGIPARTPHGWTLSTAGTQAHQWIEAYLPGRGWTEFDPLWAALGHNPIQRVPGLRIELSHRSAAKALDGQSRASWRWEGEPPVFRWTDSLWRMD